jgi:hypothetical protein
MALAEILKEIQTVKPFAEESLEGAPIETLGARRGRKFQSLERLRQLKTQYSRELGRSALFIVVTGSAREEFTSIANSLGLFSSNPEDIYMDLAKRVSPELYLGKETMVHLFDVLGRYLEDKAMELDIIGYPMLRFDEKYRSVIRNTEDFVTTIKRAINDQIGAEIAGINAVRSVVDTAISRSHDAKTTSIVLPTQDSVLVNELMRDLGRLTPKVFLVVAGKSTKAMRGIEGALSVKEPSKESVTEILKEIKNSIKK